MSVFLSGKSGKPRAEARRGLTLLSDDTLRFELQESTRGLEDRTGKRILALAYPFGGPEFLDRRIIDESEEAGY